MTTATKKYNEIVTKANNWLNGQGFKNVSISVTRGTFHLTNNGEYLITAASVLSAATGLNFNRLNSKIARLA